MVKMVLCGSVELYMAMGGELGFCLIMCPSWSPCSSRNVSTETCAASLTLAVFVRRQQNSGAKLVAEKEKCILLQATGLSADNDLSDK